MPATIPALEMLVVCSTPLSQPARGRDAVDMALASLALGWETGLLLCDGARHWLHAQQAPAAGPDPFARALASLPLYELAAVHVLDPDLRDWPSLHGMPVRVWAPRMLPTLLASARRVLHP